MEGSPQGWNRIARTVSGQHGLDLWQTARLFGLLNLASADAYIADFENKSLRVLAAGRRNPCCRYRRQSGDCGRPDVGIIGVDRTRPGVPSGHSGQGGAMSEVLARFFGDKVSLD